jgi:hypothetical protein
MLRHPYSLLLQQVSLVIIIMIQLLCPLVLRPQLLWGQMPHQIYGLCNFSMDIDNDIVKNKKICLFESVY